MPESLEAVERALREFRAESIEAHLRFLASPLLEGRGVGTRGGRIAEEYIRAVFSRAGLRPVPSLGYRQEIAMIGATPEPNLEIVAPDGTVVKPRYRDDFVLEAGVPNESVEVDAELVFVGFGITAPEYDWNDFDGVDVSDKILLIRVNDPGAADTPEFFDGHALSYYGRWTYKFEEASRRGAAGAILIHTDESAGYGWKVVRNSNTGEQYQLAGAPQFPLQARGWVTEEIGRELLSMGGEDPMALLAASDRRGFQPRPLRARVRAAVRSRIREVRTANVLALLPGSDASRDEEPVILMAHHDHLGTTVLNGVPVTYPGAYDNASGVALLLAMAEAMAAARLELRRPILFLASTAEESGLLGADWYVRHPAFPLARTAAVLNVDGANLHGATHDIAPLGIDRSTLGQVIREAAVAEGMEVSPEPHPEVGMFFRQDHFPFVRGGVPSVAFDHGLRYLDRPEGWGEQRYQEFVTTHYHQPSDAFREDFDYRGADQQGRVMLRTAIAVAQGDELPDWLPGSSFERH